MITSLMASGNLPTWYERKTDEDIQKELSIKELTEICQ